MWLDQRLTTPDRSKLEKAAPLIYILPTALFEKYSKKSSLMDKYGEFNHITTCRCEGLKSNYNYETYKLIKFKKFVAIEGFTLVDCWQKLVLLLLMVEAEEVIQRKGKRTKGAQQCCKNRLRYKSPENRRWLCSIVGCALYDLINLSLSWPVMLFTLVFPRCNTKMANFKHFVVFFSIAVSYNPVKNCIQVSVGMH